jgi:hypothetical protein
MRVSPRLLCVGGPLHGQRYHAHDGKATTRERDEETRELGDEQVYEVRTVAADVEFLVHESLLEDLPREAAVLTLLSMTVAAVMVERDRLAKHAHALFVRVKALAGAESAVAGDITALGLNPYASPAEVPIR